MTFYIPLSRTQMNGRSEPFGWPLNRTKRSISICTILYGISNTSTARWIQNVFIRASLSNGICAQMPFHDFLHSTRTVCCQCEHFVGKWLGEAWTETGKWQQILKMIGLILKQHQQRTERNVPECSWLKQRKAPVDRKQHVCIVD